MLVKNFLIMKKYFPIILLLAVLTLSACGVNKGGTETIKSEETKVNSSKSLKELLGLGTSQKCTYEVEVDGQKTKGEIVISGKKFKQTMEITTKEGIMKVNSINDGIYYYSWSDAAKGTGTKIKIEAVETAAPTGTEQKQQSVDWNEKIDYKCSPATLSESDLVIPADIKFVDLNETMKNLQNMNIEGLKNLVPTEGQ